MQNCSLRFPFQWNFLFSTNLSNGNGFQLFVMVYVLWICVFIKSIHKTQLSLLLSGTRESVLIDLAGYIFFKDHSLNSLGLCPWSYVVRWLWGLGLCLLWASFSSSLAFSPVLWAPLWLSVHSQEEQQLYSKLLSEPQPPNDSVMWLPSWIR